MLHLPQTGPLRCAPSLLRLLATHGTGRDGTGPGQAA